MNNNNGWNRRSRTAAVSVVWSAALVVALGSGLPVAAAEGMSHAGEGILLRASPGLAGIGSENLHVDANPVVGLMTEDAPAKTAAHGVADVQLAQFQLPGGSREGTGPSQREARAAELPKALTFQYAYGSDSEIIYRLDPDLNKRVRDNSILLAPTLFGIATYRPNAWLESTLEMTLSRPFAVKEESSIILPSGEIRVAEKKYLSLLVDQAFVRFKGDPFELTLGRRNFEDARLWLYDTALDSVSVKLKHGDFQTEASAGRENLLDLDLLAPVKKGRINYYILHSEYRGIEDHKLAGYAITLRDSLQQEGKPLLMGVRAYGRPSDKFNYWTELAFLRGKDELNRKFSAQAADIGGTYRFQGLAFQPSVTLGYAYASGDGNPNDNKNTEFRQTGLQSNETRFGGVTQFKRYGEAFDPELSNLKILTAGFGFRPAPNVHVDLVYHRYRLGKIGNDLRGSALTALINQDDTQLSRDVGNAFDIVLGFRNLFGVRRLGFELRAGAFFPGKAYRIEEGSPDGPTFRPADKSISALAVFIW